MEDTIIGCIILIIIALIIYPFQRISDFNVHRYTEGFNQPKQKDKDVIQKIKKEYINGTPWTQDEIKQWSISLSGLYNTFHSIQDNMQDIYSIYSKTEGQLESSARKKHTHWLTMTPSQRANANMIEDPILKYYEPITSNHSRLPFGGLKDNEGELPVGITMIALENPSAVISFDVSGSGSSSSSGSGSLENIFYKSSEKYVSSFTIAIDKLTQSVNDLTWSTNGDNTVSLLPRIKKIQENAIKKQKELNKKKEGFKSNPRIITVDVYPHQNTIDFMRKSKSIFATLRQNLKITRENVVDASNILEALNKQGKDTHNKLKSLISK